MFMEYLKLKNFWIFLFSSLLIICPLAYIGAKESTTGEILYSRILFIAVFNVLSLIFAWKVSQKYKPNLLIFCLLYALFFTLLRIIPALSGSTLSGNFFNYFPQLFIFELLGYTLGYTMLGAVFIAFSLLIQTVGEYVLKKRFS